jgi:shikimate dehydrogenase
MRRSCVIGYPAKHSRSPKIHGYWLEQHGIEGHYGIEEISPADFPGFVTKLDEHGYVGANVTMPHKEAALQYSEPDQRARSVGVSNTLWFDKAGDLKSTNTDVEGFIGALDANAPGWDKKSESAVVLGAGGAAKAVVYGLLERGLKEVHVVNRTIEKAEAFRHAFGSDVVPASWDSLPSLLKGATLLANSTSLGMHGQSDLEIDISVMAEGAVVSDIVYVPLKTDLLAAAEARGFATSNGLDMLLHQAVRGFELWFGTRPTVTSELFDMVAADIVGG